MNNKEAWKKFLLEKMRIGTSGEEIFNAGFNAGQAALASQAQQQANQEPLLTLILGGIECDEYDSNDFEWHTEAVEALQVKLVRGRDAVFVPLYMQSQAWQLSGNSVQLAAKGNLEINNLAKQILGDCGFHADRDKDIYHKIRNRIIDAQQAAPINATGVQK